ncbi:hypothetical protein [Nocardia cyriacigeorgica]|uniref:Lipoprotein n=1 Tax=Nocardia cyriacigeorgica (strain GUH-2) TaxID=1127134 RepID=H6RA51_NOCCG|nr:hypothetical protein [Nocardia cyriacigeorgica]BDT86045.1 hypothetical protein FMUAM8_18090 [Nocardia cyriacigeorgica]BDU05558.1 hypothetical protein FMUBM48_18210 [Nocardia cyriacigeorgica]CCF62456.1 conserved exported protein of unknown function; putative coiled-coil domain [Nocardia cyriacigeorgica GUH-2]
MKLLDPRGVGLVCAAAALIAGATIAGCSNSVDGTAAPNAADLSAYKTYAASSSAAATSSRKAAAQAKAIADNCGQFPVITGVGVSKYNEFVDAHDSNAPDYDAKRDTAANTLEDAANKVEAGVNAAKDDLPADLKTKLTEYVNAARALAQATRGMHYTAPVGPLNDASRRVNDARNAVRDDCSAR